MALIVFFVGKPILKTVFNFSEVKIEFVQDIEESENDAEQETEKENKTEGEEGDEKSFSTNILQMLTAHNQQILSNYWFSKLYSEYNPDILLPPPECS